MLVVLMWGVSSVRAHVRVCVCGVKEDTVCVCVCVSLHVTQPTHL